MSLNEIKREGCLTALELESSHYNINELEKQLYAAVMEVEASSFTYNELAIAYYNNLSGTEQRSLNEAAKAGMITALSSEGIDTDGYSIYDLSNKYWSLIADGTISVLGRWYVYFDGNSYITIPEWSSDGDYYIAFDVIPDEETTYILLGNSSSGYNYIAMTNENGTIRLMTDAGDVSSPSGTMTPKVESHVEVYRVGALTTLAVNGEVVKAREVGDYTLTLDMIGKWETSTNYTHTGFLSNININGEHLYELNKNTYSDLVFEDSLNPDGDEIWTYGDVISTVETTWTAIIGKYDLEVGGDYKYKITTSGMTQGKLYAQFGDQNVSMLTNDSVEGIIQDCSATQFRVLSSSEAPNSGLTISISIKPTTDGKGYNFQEDSFFNHTPEYTLSTYFDGNSYIYFGDRVLTGERTIKFDVTIDTLSNFIRPFGNETGYSRMYISSSGVVYLSPTDETGVTNSGTTALPTGDYEVEVYIGSQGCTAKFNGETYVTIDGDFSNEDTTISYIGKNNNTASAAFTMSYMDLDGEYYYDLSEDVSDTFIFVDSLGTDDSELWTYGDTTLDGTSSSYELINGASSGVLPTNSSILAELTWTNVSGGKVEFILGGSSYIVDATTETQTGSYSFVFDSGTLTRAYVQDRSGGTSADLVTVAIRETTSGVGYNFQDDSFVGEWI